MKGLNNEPMTPQTFLYGCILEAGKEVVFNPDDDELEHQLDLRMACVDPSSKDELHLVEVEGQDSEGQKVKAALVSLKPSTLPSVCLGGFTVTPPTVFRLKTGSGPVHLSGQHLIMMENDESFDEDDDEEEEEEEDEAFPVSRKRSMQFTVAKSQKKQKMEAGDDEDDEEEDEDDEEDEEDDEESEAEESPVKAKRSQPKATVAKQKGPAQNGKNSAQSTPAPKQKAPKGKDEKSPKTQATPKVNLTLPQLKTKLMEAMKKGITLPKVQPKFENFVKNSNKVSDPQIIADLWKWRQTLKDEK